MSYWLIAFVMINGQYDHKIETQYKSKTVCERVEKTKQNRNVVTFCVSNDHYIGQKYDKDVPLD